MRRCVSGFATKGSDDSQWPRGASCWLAAVVRYALVSTRTHPSICSAEGTSSSTTAAGSRARMRYDLGASRVLVELPGVCVSGTVPGCLTSVLRGAEPPDIGPHEEEVLPMVTQPLQGKSR